MLEIRVEIEQTRANGSSRKKGGGLNEENVSIIIPWKKNSSNGDSKPRRGGNKEMLSLSLTTFHRLELDVAQAFFSQLRF